MRTTSLTALAALSAGSQALKLDRSGQVVGFDMHRHEHPKEVLRKRGVDGTVETAATFASQLYYINITLGTPGQNLAVQIDTGSSDFWVPDTHGGCGQGCVIGSFDPKQSSSFKVTQPGAFNSSYADLTDATGDFGTDVLQFGGLTLDNVTVGVASQVKTSGTIEGIMGLSFPSLEANAQLHETVNPTVLDTLVDNGKIGAHVFSLYLNDIHSTGSLLFGGVDTAKFSGELGILDLQAAVNGTVGDFTVALTGVSFSNGQGAVSTLDLGAGAMPALLDSGTTDTVLPNAVAQGIYEGLGLEYATNNVAIIPCNANVKGLSLNFTFGGPSGPNIGVPLSQFIAPFDPTLGLPNINGQQTCQFAIQPVSEIPDGENTVILGDSFLRGAYLVYDLDNLQIAMAPAILNATASNVVAVAAPNGSGDGESGDGSSAAPTALLPSNSIPSASLVADQTSLSINPAAQATDPGVLSTAAATTFTTPTATFKGLASGFPTKNAAPGITRPADSTGLWVAAITLLLTAMGGGVLAVL